MKKRLLSLLLVATLLLSLLPGTVLAIESEPGTPTRTEPVVGSFPMLAITEEGFLIEPCYVSYAAGETLKDALRYSGHTFTGLDSGFISAVDGHADNYTLHYAGDGYSLDGAASDVIALWFTTNASQSYSDDALALVSQMARYLAGEEYARYEKAADAYAEACGGFYSANAADAATLCDALQGAMDALDNFKTGQTVQLRMNITLDGVKLTTGKAVFTSEFGTETTVTDLTAAALVPATYTFDISDGDYRHVRGTVTVAEGSVITAELPTGNWIADLDLSTDGGGKWKALPKSDATIGGATFYVSDYKGPSLYPCVIRNETYATDKDEYCLYLAGKETKPQNKRTWGVKNTVLANVIEADSLTDVDLVLECRRRTMDENGYELYQSYTMRIRRVPTLSGLTVSGEGTPLNIPFDADKTEYDSTVISDLLQVCPTATLAGTAITVNGHSVESGKAADVLLADCIRDAAGKYLLNITLTAPNGQKNTYQLKLERVEALITRLTMPSSAVTVQLFNSGNALCSPTSIDGLVWTYRTIPGESYTYISTARVWYHATASITPAAGSTDFTVAAPKTEDWLADLAAKAANNNKAKVYELNQTFDPTLHSYSMLVDSNTSTFYLSAYAGNTSKYTTTANYLTHNNSAYSDYANSLKRTDQTKTPGVKDKFANMSNFMQAGGWGNDMTVRVQQNTVESGVTYYQEYALHVNRSISMNAMSIADPYGTALILAQKDDPSTQKFDKFVLSYTTSLASEATEMQVSVKPLSTYKYDHDFTVTVSCDGWSKSIVYSEAVPVNVAQSITVPMSGTRQTQILSVTVSHSQSGSVAQTYTIEVMKLPPVVTTFVTTPANAMVFLTEDATGTRIYPEADGTYILNDTASYTYVITCNGYVAQKVTFVAGEENATITVNLEKAPQSDLKDLLQEGDWPLFRADEQNNGVTGYRTPIRAEDAVLEWANKIGEGYGSGATGCPIIVGGYLYTYAGESIVKVNKDTGEVVGSGKMVASSSFAINSPTYADGMIFVGLSGGRVQAFNAETLDSLWVYTDALGGQPDCPIAYSEGYIYTGFWNSETKQANFVCLSVTDEDPTSGEEVKYATWTYAHNGFYWAGAYACHDYVVVGTDDGASGYTTGTASILSLNPRTGELLDEQKLSNVGDQRSSICYDAETDACYFTTKGGDFYQIRLNADGTFRDGSLRRLHLDNGSDNTTYPPMSTSTPVVYKGRAYIGVSGTSQFGVYSGHNLTVIDLESFSIAYTVPTMGYPQTSGLLTTAYEGEDGYVYVYFFDNYTPGKLRVIRDRKDMTEVDHTYTTMESYLSGGETITIETGYVLFTPSGSEAQYAICSPIADSDGNLYFKNDTARLMRLSSRIVSLEIVRQPDKLIYEPGMVFDGTGLQVKAHYANGNVKDVTSWITYSQEKLKIEDTELTISLDPDRLLVKENGDGYWKWYRDFEGEAGKVYDLPTISVTLDLRADHADDDHDHKCDACEMEMGEHKAAEGSHNCDYCGQPVSECADENHDHECDICGNPVGDHKAAEGSHNCDYCGKPASECVDENRDHKCDTCGNPMGEHKAAEGSHNCDYCGQPASECEDENKDHECDICGNPMGEHKAAEGSHNCDYCGKPASECEDKDKDHKCDTCDAVMSECADEDGDHKCDICGKDLNEDPDDGKEDPDDGNENPGEGGNPPSGDTTPLLLLALLLIGSAAAVVLSRKKFSF